MHILITGGCGYKGTKLVSLLLAEGHRVSVYDKQWFGNHLENNSNLQVFNIDVRNLENIELKDVDSVIHLASVANDPCSDLSPKLAWEVSTLATMKLVEKSVKSGVSQFIYASSGSVYGIKDEEQVTEDLDLVPISDYNKGKMVAERVLLSYSEQIRIAIVRPATVCGFSPRMRLDVAVNLLTMQALEHGEITVLGGRQIRPNIHIDDICNL
jgi:nucleoside-diphosphate-sugar epimerase